MTTRPILTSSPQIGKGKTEKPKSKSYSRITVVQKINIFKKNSLPPSSQYKVHKRTKTKTTKLRLVAVEKMYLLKYILRKETCLQYNHRRMRR